jgi:hypothetical protein
LYQEQSRATLSSTNDLSTGTHLIGSRQHEEDDARDAVYDEEERGIPCSLKIVYDEELEDSQSSSDNKQSYFLSFVLRTLPL